MNDESAAGGAADKASAGGDQTISDCGDGTLLSRAIEVAAPTPARAAQLLDFALSARHVDEWGRPAHMVFTLHVHQRTGNISS